MAEKYISFDPWWGGFSNIRMSYELVAAISIITGRTIILPPKVYCLFLSQHEDKNTWFDMWDAMDRNAFTSEFKCIEYKDVPEYINLENNKQYFENVESVAKNILFTDNYKDWGPQDGPRDNDVITCNVTDTEDFNAFGKDRRVINLNLEDKFIHFPRNLFGHFYYHVYGDGPIQRNIIKEKIKNGVTYKSEFFEKAKKVKNVLGNYNAIHIRRNDFLVTRTSTAVPQLSTLRNDIKEVIKKDLPLYIATDEKDKSLFHDLTNDYHISFLDYYYPSLKQHEALVIEQIICSEANAFLGSKFSTYSDYINVLRGYGKKADYHRRGTNFTMPVLNYNRFPWEKENYSWDKIWDYCWNYERSYFNLGIYGSHNSAVAISYQGAVLEVIELERWLNEKNAAFYYHFPISNPLDVAKDIYNYLKKKYNVYLFDHVMYNSCMGAEKMFPAFTYQWVPHHVAHISNAMYQSTATRTLNVSFDGGSDEGFFNVYICDKGKDPEKIANFRLDVAVPYQTTAHYLACIKREDNWWRGNLVYAGKIMGLASYGNPNEDLLNKYREFYRGQHLDDVNVAHERFQKIFNISVNDRIDGQYAFDLAKCNQMVFEEIIGNLVQSFKNIYPDRELQFSGGGAMNIMNNSVHDAFVSPNPDDRGLALGLLLYKIRPGLVDSTYLGSEPYDELPAHKDYTVNEVVGDLINGEILGLIQGRSEHGARSLGNRSIICLPRKGMKDLLNSKVKFRESFRPYAPIVRLEDARTYFDFGKYSRWMTHNSMVKEEYEEQLHSITHVDGSARLQTVTKEQNEFIYNILTELKNRGEIPVILNTSFNIQGKPILNTYKDALWMRENTGLNKVITDKYILL